jgi:hypothetical protein
MKIRFSSLVVMVLAWVMLGQAATSNFARLKFTCGTEAPMEESADEDPDNEGEFDKVFQNIAIENIDLSYTVSHHSFFESDLTELIREIVPPPPKV